MYVKTLTDRNYELRLRANDKGVQESLTKVYGSLIRVDRAIGDVENSKLTIPGIVRAQAQLIGLDASMDRADATLKRLAGDQDKAGAATARFTGLWGILTNRMRVPLFGGGPSWLPKILIGIGSLHLLLDVLFEVIAVVIPATIALAAFGLAGSDAAKAIFVQMQNLHTVMDATGKTIPPFTRNLEKMHDAVRPQVYQLFGEALSIINAKTGEFNKLAIGTGRVLDQLGARIAVALKTGGFSIFMRNAVLDVKLLGDAFGNLFGIIGNLLRSMPGVAQVLLRALGSVTHAIENVTGSAATQRVLSWGLIAHGALIYVGLAATAAGKLVSGGLGGIAKIATSSAGKLVKLGEAGAGSAIALDRFAMQATKLQKLPWGWILAAAIGIGILAFKIMTAKDATQKWADSLQNALAAQNAVTGGTLLMIDQVLVAHRLTGAQQELTQAWKSGAIGAQDVHIGLRNVNDALGDAQRKVSDLTGAQRTLTDQSNLYNSRLDRIAVHTGGVTEAQGLLVASGITMKQMLDKNRQAWLMIMEQITATKAAYAAMGQTAGVLGGDMNALNIAASDQFKAMQNLNSGLDTVFKTLTGGQDSFISFEQDIRSVNESFNQVGGTGRIVVKTFDAVTGTTKSVHASMDGLSAASLQLRGTWQTAFEGAQALADALRSMSSISPGGFPPVTRAIMDMIKQLVPLGKQGKASRSELISMANAINPNITNFKELTKWLGSTKGAGKDLNKVIAAMGINIQDLAKDALSLRTTLQQDIIKQFDLAKENAVGLGGAISAVATDITHQISPASKTGSADITTLYKKMIQAKLSASDATTQILAMTGGIKVAGNTADEKQRSLRTLRDNFENAGLSAKAATKLVEGLTGEIIKVPTHHQTILTAKAFAQGLLTYKLAIPHEKTAKGTLEFHARGGRVGGRGNHDSVAAMLTPGEVVVPKPMVASGMVDHLRGMLPGFAGGGVVGGNAAIGRNLSKIVPFMDAAAHTWEVKATKAWTDAAEKALVRGVNALASGSITWPFPGGRRLSELRRVDEGQDMQYPGTRPVNVYAILPGRRTTHGGDPGGFGTSYPGMVLDRPAFGFKEIYYGHIRPAGGGGHVGAGDVIGRTMGPTSGGDAAGLPNWLELGFWPPNYANGPAMHRLLLHGLGGAGTGGPGKRGGVWTTGGMARLWDQAGGPPNLAHLMGAIGKAESGGRAWIRNSIGASGLWQILMPQNRWAVHGNVFNPAVNAEAAVSIWARQGLRAWEAYTNGSYLQFMNKGGMVKSFDKGGWLMPGTTIAHNRTGRPEPVGHTPHVVLEIHSGPSQFDQFMTNWLQHAVRTKGGGNVQLTFGTQH